MGEYMSNAVAMHAWHEIIYCSDNERRNVFLNDMINDYPIKIDSDEPAIVYVDDFMLPNTDLNITTLDSRVQSIAREYLSFTLIASIVEQTIRQENLEKINKKLTKFIGDINRLYIDDEKFFIRDVSDLLDVLKKSKEFYKEHYVELMNRGIWNGDFSTIPMSFVEFGMFISAYKRGLNRSSHFGLILNYNGSGAVVSQRAVNGLVTRRIAGDAAIKLVCEPGIWKTYHDLNGMLAEDVHDYSSIDLDGSLKKHIKQLRYKE